MRYDGCACFSFAVIIVMKILEVCTIKTGSPFFRLQKFNIWSNRIRKNCIHSLYYISSHRHSLSSRPLCVRLCSSGCFKWLFATKRRIHVYEVRSPDYTMTLAVICVNKSHNLQREQKMSSWTRILSFVVLTIHRCHGNRKRDRMEICRCGWDGVDAHIYTRMECVREMDKFCIHNTRTHCFGIGSGKTLCHKMCATFQRNGLSILCTKSNSKNNRMTKWKLAFLHSSRKENKSAQPECDEEKNVLRL